MSDGNIRQQIGEILGSTRGTQDQLRELKDNQSRQEERLSGEIRTIRNEANQQISAVNTRLQEIRNEVNDLRRSTDALTKDIGEMREPVNELTAWQNKIVTYGAVIGAVIMIVWFVLEPVMREVIAKWLK